MALLPSSLASSSSRWPFCCRRHDTYHACHVPLLGHPLLPGACLKWNHGPQSGAFKRVMTYTYLLTVPLLIIYSVSFAVIKYKMGWSLVPGFGILPTPWEFWPQKYKSAIFPLYLIFSISWGLEMVTHLEELCFWLFLVNAGRGQQDWFRSLYFKCWAVGSVLAVAYMPIVTIFTRSDPLKCEAYTFLAGSLGSLSLTLWFLPILYTFPSFLENLRKENVEIGIVIRLTKFHELNSIRIAFRFMFVVPLLVLGVDGIRPHQHVNDSNFWTEFLAIIAAIGVVVSSAITLTIFFPRSAESEYAVKQASLQKTQNSHHANRRQSQFQRSQILTDRSLAKSPVSYNSDFQHPSLRGYEDLERAADMGSPVLNKPTLDIDEYTAPTTSFSPNRRLESGATLQGNVTVISLTAQNLARHNAHMPHVNPLVSRFTSPIDLVDNDRDQQWW
ncbi:hypothetical protein NM688_g3178 [Phlebia brevispora]|uniref:Uncharacterized protein n=1 Tax=Phlebia brevispora TaxID=194682 RepID=A0ACC1T6K9_9APHY|nr:hypothetical protein NM688_g3178 [Phlebia brevispora]